MNRCSLAWQLLRCLGPRWLLLRGAYAARQRSGWDAWRLPVSTWDSVPLASVLRDGVPVEPSAYAEFRSQSGVRSFIPVPTPECPTMFAAWDAENGEVGQNAARIQSGEFRFFEDAWVQCGLPPDWLRNPFTGQMAPAEGHWIRLDEFGSGDIKLIWELNRFAFVFTLVRAYWRTGDESLPECFWQLVEDWRTHNPPQVGVNWKCGQEASLRVMAWCFGLVGFGGAAASSPVRIAGLAQMLAVSGKRIASNLSYALSQRNNHGISEAAGLWTLGMLFPEFRLAAGWCEMGREALESQARELIYDDGGFSQHSVNYHRVMVEDYLWCIQLGRANRVEFTPELVKRVGLAGEWLECLLDPATGCTPNWGSNDGAHVLPLSNCHYLDYRPVVQAAAIVTAGKASLPPGPWDEQAWWLGCPVATRAAAETWGEDSDQSRSGGRRGAQASRIGKTDQAKSQSILASVSTLRTDSDAPITTTGRQDLPNSGLTVLRAGAARVVLRTARRFRHRPAQCDFLHLDLWSGASNVLRDSGSYSYNAPDDSGTLFKSVAAHNTIQFDGHDQMPVLGRFLYGQWPHGEVSLPADDPTKIVASYVDWHGCRHERTVTLGLDRCLVSDRLSGFQHEAVMRWHLSPQVDWELSGSACASSLAVIRVTAAGIKSSRLSDGWESLFYNSKTPLRVFEITVAASCGEIETEITLARAAALDVRVPAS